MHKSYRVPAGILQPGATIEYLDEKWWIVGREDFLAPGGSVLVVFTAIRPDIPREPQAPYPRRENPTSYHRLPFHDDTPLLVRAQYHNLPFSDLEEDMRACEYDRIMRGEEPLRRDLAPGIDDGNGDRGGDV